MIYNDVYIMFEGVGKLQCSHLNSCWNGPSSHPQTFFWGLALRAQAVHGNSADIGNDVK
jgi:hypothetical protein